MPLFHWNNLSDEYTNIMRFINNKDYWNNDDFKFYESLNIDKNIQLSIGPNRNKYKLFYNYIKTKYN